MSENRFTKRVSTLPMLSSKCSHDNLNMTLRDFACNDNGGYKFIFNVIQYHWASKYESA